MTDVRMNLRSAIENRERVQREHEKAKEAITDLRSRVGDLSGGHLGGHVITVLGRKGRFPLT
jgi:hypothetical protein